VAGFDILYALQDEEFDRRAGLHSLPARVGARLSRQGAACCHLLAALAFGLTGWWAELGRLYAGAAILSALILVAQHLGVARKETQRFPPAFFTLNSLIGLGLSLAAWISLMG
jgi:4-hydroxybenzoate polyprenyltransferase